MDTTRNTTDRLKSSCGKAFDTIDHNILLHNNNKKTSLAPISSENPSSVAQQNQGLGILVTMYNAKSRQPMDGGAKKLRRIGHFEKIGFQITAK